MDALYSVPSIVLSAAFMGLLLLAMEIGIRGFGLKRNEGTEAAGPTYGVVLGSVLALLGLLLGFSFSMSAGRYDTRRLLQLEEANAIGTLYLRADLLSDSERDALRPLIREFTDLRLAIHDAPDRPQAEALHAQTLALQAKIWAIVTTAARNSPESDSLALLVDSANAAFDVSTARTASYRQHVSEVIPLMIVIVSMIGAMLLGAGGGPMNQRNWLALLAFAGCLAIVFFAILDLDRPRKGLIQIPQTLMQEVRSGMGE